jgi:hypothetical protein
MDDATEPTDVMMPDAQVMVVPSHFTMPAVVDGDPLVSDATGSPL